MTMKGKKFNPGFRDQLDHKIYSCEDTSNTKNYEVLKFIIFRKAELFRLS